MVTSEERRKILEMVSDGKLSAGEAADLLSAGAKEVAPQPEPKASTGPDVPKGAPLPEKPGEAGAPATGPSWLHVRVGDLKTGKRKVTVNIPLHLVKFGLKMGGAFTPRLDQFDWSEITEALAAGEKGILVDVADEEDGEHVQIYVD